MYSEFSDSESVEMGRLPEIEVAKTTTVNLLPEKSKQQYTMICVIHGLTSRREST